MINTKRRRRIVNTVCLLLCFALLHMVSLAAHILDEDSVGINTVPFATQELHGEALFEKRQLSMRTRISVAPIFAASAPNVEIQAQSAIVINYDTGEVLYEKDADTPLAPASMTKVMTAYLIFEELEAGNLTLDTKVVISARNSRLSRDPNYPAMVNLRAGSRVSVDTLLKLILLPSSSASCIVMAEHISGTEAAFTERMNETAQRLGMEAEYKNSHGAFTHYLTARAQATLVREFIQRFPTILDYTSLESVYFNEKIYYNTNKMVQDSYYYEGCDGFKTGTTVDAGYCFSATAVREDRRLISVVMRSIGDHYRFTDTEAILNAGFQQLNIS